MNKYYSNSSVLEVDGSFLWILSGFGYVKMIEIILKAVTVEKII